MRETLPIIANFIALVFLAVRCCLKTTDGIAFAVLKMLCLVSVFISVVVLLVLGYNELLNCVFFGYLCAYVAFNNKDL